MWDAHRAEGCAAISHGFVGEVSDVRDEVKAVIGDLDDERLYNIAVSNGIVAMLDQLTESGYTLHDCNGKKVELGKHKSLGDAWKAWFKKRDPNLKLV
jgi:hypothetical protein